MTGKVYESARATVLHADAREVLAEREQESVDLVVVDPPYGVEFQSGMRAESFAALTGDGEHEREGVRKIIELAVRSVGQHRHLYVFGPTDVLEGQKVAEPVSLVWDKMKPGMGDLSSAWAPAHEPIAFTISKYRHGGRSGDESVAARMRKGTVLRFSPPTGRKVRHPTEKPVPLLAELIESSSRHGDLVLDPCAGSGSTGVAAVLRGRRALLIEVDERWAHLAADRLAKAERLVDAMEGV